MSRRSYVLSMLSSPSPSFYRNRQLYSSKCTGDLTGASSSLTGWPLISTPESFRRASSASSMLGKAITLGERASAREHYTVGENPPIGRVVAVNVGVENVGTSHTSIVFEVL